MCAEPYPQFFEYVFVIGLKAGILYLWYKMWCACVKYTCAYSQTEHKLLLAQEWMNTLVTDLNIFAIF